MVLTARKVGSAAAGLRKAKQNAPVRILGAILFDNLVGNTVIKNLTRYFNGAC
jgi:hypothetical protein